MIGLLEQYPELGILVQGREIRRVLMPETEQFIYYRVRRRAMRIEVIALWGGRREFGPPLPRR